MDTKYEFEQSLDDLMDIINKTCKRVARYSLLSDTISDHVIGTIDNTRDFINLMKEIADGEPDLYDYDLKLTSEVLYGNLNIILSNVDKKRARALISLRLNTLHAMSGDDISGKMEKARNMTILHPKDVTEEHLKAKTRGLDETATDKMTIKALEGQCKNGNQYACEALEAMQYQGNLTNLNKNKGPVKYSTE